VLTTDAGFASLGAEWDDLLTRAAVDTPLLTHTWQRSWWEAYGGGRSVFLVTVRSDAHLVAVAPLFMDRVAGVNVLRLIGHGRLDDLGFIVDSESTTAWNALADALISHPSWDAIELHSWTLGLRSAGRLRDAMGSRFIYAAREYEKCPYISSSEGWNAYLAQRKASFRKWLKKADRKAQGHGPTKTEHLRGREITADKIAELADLERRSAHWQHGTAHFADPRFGDLIRRVADRCDGGLELLGLRIGGVLASAELLAVSDEAAMGLWTTYDQAYASSGTYIVGQAIKATLNEGCTRFEFLQGDESYKMYWATDSRVVHQVVLARRNARGLSYSTGCRLRWRAARSARLRRWSAALRSR